jgi:predicted NUDIX family NTP pyrophosphohydrolase
VKTSAGLLFFRRTKGHLEVLLVHPGGPFWANKDEGVWSIPKGELEGGEEPLAAARREFEEETGLVADGDVMALGSVRQPSGKIVHAWAMERDADAAAVQSNPFTVEWPPHSGKMEQFPEVDKAGWFSIESARRKILKAQAEFLTRLEDILGEK